MNDIKEYTNPLRPEEAGQTMIDKGGYDNIGEKLVPLDLSDALALIGRMKADHLAALAEKDNADLELRLFIALNHGHEGIYLDDGEIQCGRCMQLSKTFERVWDYKRNPLPQLIRQALLARNQQIASLTEDFEAMARTAGLQAEELKEIKEEIKRKNEYVDNFHGLGKRPLKDTIRVENEIALNQSEAQWLNR